MAKTDKITLGGQEYTVHAFNIDELEQVAAIITSETMPQSSRSFSILKLALLRADPKVADVGSIEPDSLEEVTRASTKVLELSGLKAKENPQETGAEAATAP